MPTDIDTSEALASVFQFLARSGIRYCVVGRLDETGGGHRGDIDIVVDPAGLGRLLNEFADFCRASGLPIIRRLRHAQGVRYDLGWSPPAGRIAIVPLDFTADLTSHNRLLMRAEELLDGSDPESGPHPCRAQPAREFRYYLTKRVAKGNIDESAASYLSSLWQAAPEQARREIRRQLSRSHATLVEQAAASSDWEEVCARLPGMRAAQRARAGISLAAFARSAYSKAMRVLRPVGLVVRLTGSDAAASSALIDDLGAMTPQVFAYTLRHKLGPVTGARGILSCWYRWMTRVVPARVRNALVIVEDEGAANGPQSVPVRPGHAGCRRPP